VRGARKVVVLVTTPQPVLDALVIGAGPAGIGTGLALAAAGAALIPVQMILQLALFPLWLALFAGRQIDATVLEAGPTLLTWFVVGVGLRLLLRAILPASWRERMTTLADGAVPLLIAAVIVALFAGNVEAILADPASFAWVLLVVFLFFLVTFALGEGVSRLFRLERPQHVLLTMTTSARNAPLMLAVTAVALPGQPVLHAAIVLGMLVEFPHLTALVHLFRRRLPAPVAPAGQSLSRR
jgi:ACR3 family arsenite efflux pump ArsB